MDHELTDLTFLEDPGAYQAQPGDLCVQVPAGISVAQNLVEVLQEQLGFPPISNRNWYRLQEYLSFWLENLRDLPRRVVILHQDLPLWQAYRLWWLDVQGYLHALTDTIARYQESQTRGEPVRGPELVAVFPQGVYEELRAVLTRPPDWYLNLEYAGYDHEITTEIDPPWSLIQEYISHLDGLIAEVCTLSRQGVGYMAAQYLKHTRSYCLQYTSSDGRATFFASEKEQPATWPPTISLDQAEKSFQRFFTQEPRTGVLFWLPQPEGVYTTGLTLKLAHFRGPEEALLDLNVFTDPVLSILVRGIGEALREKQAAFDLEYWRQASGRTEAPLSQRLAAICLIGRSDLPNAVELLRPLLHSPVKQERWVSARFCGMWKEEEALPVLLSMLTDELPFARPEESTREERYEKKEQYEWGWYDEWRWHAPYLLRSWQTQEIGERLREALAIWVQEEPSFKYEQPTYPEEEENEEEWNKLIQVSISFAVPLCFESGYRGDVRALESLTIGKRYRYELQRAIEEGARVKEKCKTALEEYLYRTGKPRPSALLGWGGLPS